MKYDCDFIRDVTPLYKDGALSDSGARLVREHLAECEACRRHYESYSDDPPAPAACDAATGSAAALARKLTAHRLRQAGLLLGTLVFLSTMALPWFGYPGLTEILGVTVLRHPAAITGLGAFLFAVWYDSWRVRGRLLCGTAGLGLLLLSMVHDFLALPFGSTVGLQLGFLQMDIPSFYNFSLADCFSYALPGFWLGAAALAALGAAFGLFLRRQGKTALLHLT